MFYLIVLAFSVSSAILLPHWSIMESGSAASECIHVDDLKNLVGELRMMARRFLVSEGTHSFTPTALAMTALRRAKLSEQDWNDVRWENRGHFFASLNTAMRHALIDVDQGMPHGRVE